MPKKGNFKIFKFDHSLVFSYLHLLFPPKKFSLKIYYNIISLPCALAFLFFIFCFFTRAPLFPLSLQNLLDHVSR